MRFSSSRRIAEVFLGSELNSGFYLAVTGAAFERLVATCPGGDPAREPSSPLARVLMLAPVFARMSPDGKTRLIELLIQAGFTVGMCGDGGPPAVSFPYTPSSPLSLPFPPTPPTPLPSRVTKPMRLLMAQIRRAAPSLMMGTHAPLCCRGECLCARLAANDCGALKAAHVCFLALPMRAYLPPASSFGTFPP